MILSWMLYACTLALLLAMTAASLETVVRQRGWPVRGLWVGALLGSVLLPLLAMLLPRRGFEFSARSVPAASETPTRAQIPWEGVGPIRTLPAEAPPFDPDPWLLGLWFLASTAIAVGIVASQCVLLRRRREWAFRKVDGRSVWIAPETGPAVVGFLRSRIVLPEWVLEREIGERTLILAHEEEHLRAGDPQLLLGSLLVLLILPWNLPLWWQWRRLRLAVELDCDRRVLRRGLDVRAYSRLLVIVGERGTAHRLVVAALSESSSALERRIRFMLAPRPRRWWLRVARSTCLAAGSLLTACAVDRPADLPQLPTERGRTASDATSSIPGEVSSDTACIVLAQEGVPRDVPCPPREEIPRTPSGTLGGGFRLSPRADVKFSTTFEGEAGRVDVLVVGRVDPDRRGSVLPQPSSRSRPPLRGTGGTIGGVWYLYDPRTGDLWINQQRVPLNGNNVVLVDRADGLKGEPTVVKMLRVDSAFRLEQPAAHHVSHASRAREALRAKLESISEVRAFVDP